VPRFLADAAATAGFALPRPLLWLALATVAAARLAWLVLYLVFARGSSPLNPMTSTPYPAASEHARAEIHQGVAAETNRMADTCLIVGTLALGAWTALFVVAGQGPAAELSPASRSLLLVGAAVLIAAPVIFRVPDLHTSYIGRRSAQFIGFTAVGLAFASLANDLLGGFPRLAVTAAAILLLVGRDLCDTIGEIRFEHQLLRPDTTAVAPSAPAAGALR
jgi:hypothetical protein